MTRSFSVCLLGASLLALTTVLGTFLSTSEPVVAEEPAAKSVGEPVEPDMHEFMEYVFQPTYRRLKVSMATAPTENRGWSPIKADALSLAESSNLLFNRGPEDEAADWAKHATEARDAGGELYRAAKSRNFELSREKYELMLTKCNACHTQFAGGEHQLTP